MTTQHTPGPWNFKDRENGNDAQAEFPTKINFGLEGYGVGSVVGSVYVWMRDLDTAKANAAFIVRACNSHDDLLAALQSISTLASCAPNDDEKISGQEFTRIMNTARAAIAKATAP